MIARLTTTSSLVAESPLAIWPIFTEARAVRGQGRGPSIAVFKLKGKLSALSNVCLHQGGPVGAGKVVLGLVICQWHGYQ